MVNSSLTNIKKCNAIFIYANRRKVMNCEYTPKQTVIPHNFLWTMTKQRNLENSKHLATGMFNHYSGFNCYAIGKMCACLICSCTTASMTFYKLLHHTLTVATLGILSRVFLFHFEKISSHFSLFQVFWDVSINISWNSRFDRYEVCA